jgi:hypothetical protein
MMAVNLQYLVAQLVGQTGPRSSWSNRLPLVFTAHTVQKEFRLYDPQGGSLNSPWGLALALAHFGFLHAGRHLAYPQRGRPQGSPPYPTPLPPLQFIPSFLASPALFP